jgi:hypothetical protein
LNLLIYSNKESPRLSYILDLLIKELSGLSYEITHNRNHFSNFNGPKINYSQKQFDNKSIWIKPHTLLFEDNISKQETDISEWDNIKIFFLTSGECDLPFDIFAASFFLVSRYEEYLPGKTDKYGRFDVSDSIAYIHGFVDKPVIDQWVAKLQVALHKKFPELSFPGKEFKYISSIDIDNAWAYLHKGFLRTTGAVFKSLLKFDCKDLGRRIRTLTGACDDPYDNFSYIHDQEKKYNFSSLYFFLAGKYGKYDKNIPPGNQAFQDLILDKHERAETGIHPSYNSNKDFSILKNEVSQFAEITKSKVEKSRQHYLILKLPDTYRNLIELGISYDYSMGYSKVAGFRAGISNPFKFYDLSKDQETNLVIVPFHIMDVTLCEFMKLQPDEAINTIREIVLRIKEVNGTFVSLWHNESFSEVSQWKGWRRVYEEMLKIIYGF